MPPEYSDSNIFKAKLHNYIRSDTILPELNSLNRIHCTWIESSHCMSFQQCLPLVLNWAASLELGNIAAAETGLEKAGDTGGVAPTHNKEGTL